VAGTIWQGAAAVRPVGATIRTGIYFFASLISAKTCPKGNTAGRAGLNIRDIYTGRITRLITDCAPGISFIIASPGSGSITGIYPVAVARAGS